MKRCSSCKETKTLEDFPPDLRCRGGRGAKCRVCAKRVQEDYYAKYPEAEASRRLKNANFGAQWYRRNRSRQIKRMKWGRILKTYGMTESDYYNMLKMQDNVCAVCESSDPGRGDGHFAIDHDHSTGIVRGLLCQKCNCGIGFFGDDVQRMRKAINYVEGQSRKTKALYIVKTGTD